MINCIVLTFENKREKYKEKIEVPTDITADELVESLSEAYKLETSDKIHMSSENPIRFLSGEKTLDELGLRHGSVIIYK
jgi:hypothetical protein